MELKLLMVAMAATGLSLLATTANAAMTTDAHGNVGYDSYDECVAAVQDGTAKFYTSYTYQRPKRWAGEASVSQMKLSEVQIPNSVVADKSFNSSDYTAGACDKGVGQARGRYGVSGVLVGKYVPFSPDMTVNVYKNRAGVPVRITMQQCDNHFGAKFPTPISSIASVVPVPAAQLAIQEEVIIEPVVIKETRSIRPSQSNQYQVKKVIIAPVEQIQRVATNNGTAVVIDNGTNQAVVVGTEVNPKVLDNATVDGDVTVIEVPHN
ncbi:hypothetical protein [Psychrobacter sp. I-STPA10]|uniref:hypothetical protein n=1 Tax=Psychrobacter sp. I-STPA10 TaxID=2585769 RepID=UPI001E59955B|nr:hypothetical protein [Psychrobacter sp. I-STPA10]